MATIIYASKSRQTFFNDDHPSYRKTIMVPDLDWEPPHVIITLQPGEAYGNTVNESDEPVAVNLGPDQSIERPQIEVPNPNCLLPEDAVPVSLAVRDACLQAVHGINWDTDPPTAAQAPAIDQAAEWAKRRAEAGRLISATNDETLQSVESLLSGEALPSTAAGLVAYRRALRAIVNAPTGNPNLALPTRD